MRLISAQTWLAAAGLLVALPHASSAADATAESLFREAATLLEASKFSEACPKLEASQSIEPRSGTLITLAFCHAHQGRTATAWAEYLAAAELARREGRDPYMHKATRLASKLEPMLCRIRLALGPGVAATGRFTLDGRAVPPGQLGAAVPVDPGPHEVVRRSSGHASWSQTIEATPSCGVLDVVIPPLVPMPSAAPVAVPTKASSPPVLGYTLGAVGVATAIAGGALGVMVLSRQSTIADECDEAARVCSSTGLDAVESARPMAVATNILLATGAVVSGVGLYLVLTHDDGESTSTIEAGPTVGGGALRYSVSF